jgi:ataxin-3
VYRKQNAYICNLQNHWFTLRKFSLPYRWYNLDSTQSGPTYLGENYLAMMLDQIEREGYSIFAVKGAIPESRADRKARTLIRPQGEQLEDKPLSSLVPFSGTGYSLVSSSSPEITEEDEEAMLAKAIQASMEDTKPTVKNDMEEIRRKRLARFGA